MIARRVALTRPEGFRSNEQTRATNAFQTTEASCASQVLLEHTQLARALSEHGVDVIWLPNDLKQETPDAVFLNNWFSTHPGGRLIVYPMLHENRQSEVTALKLEALKSAGYQLELDLREEASAGEALEGTGSLVFDHANKVVLAGVSPRTTPRLVEIVANSLGYQPIFAKWSDREGRAVYHTNVVLTIAPRLAICCMEGLEGDLSQALSQGGRTVIEINQGQVEAFCGNCLVVGDYLWMSRQAERAFSTDQMSAIQACYPVRAVELGTIEAAGGGGVRCCLAELF